MNRKVVNISKVCMNYKKNYKTLIKSFQEYVSLYIFKTIHMKETIKYMSYNIKYIYLNKSNNV